MSKKPLLTHVMVGRNDNYLGNFKHRLELAVNYICNGVAATNNQKNYELLIVDWNSETPLRDALNLNERARQCTSFLEVPPEVVQKNKPSDSVLDIPTAVNVGLRRASGRMVMASPADALFPLASIKALFDLLEEKIPFVADLDKCYLGIERFLIPWQTSERLTENTIERYLVQHQSGFHFEPRLPGISGGEGAQLFSKKLVTEMQGFDESNIYWGGSDREIVLRINQRYPMLKLTHFGVFCYDLSQPSTRRRAALKNNNIIHIPLTEKVNDTFWGLGNVAIEKTPALECPDICNEPDRATLPYDLTVSGHTRASDFLGMTGSLWSSMLRQKWFARVGFWLASHYFPLYQRPKNKLGSKFHTVLCFLAFKALACKWINHSRKKNPEYFFSEWFGDKNTLQRYLDVAFGQRLFTKRSSWDMANACAFIALLATMGRRQPLRFLYCPRREYYIARAAIFVDPTMEITGYDHWIGQDENTGRIGGVLMEAGFKGYYHALSGTEKTAFERLREGRYIGEPYQVLFLDLDFMQDSLSDLSHRAEPLMDTPCTIICKGDSHAQALFKNTLQGFTVVGNLPGVVIYDRNA